jgi:hypothetical protein
MHSFHLPKASYFHPLHPPSMVYLALRWERKIHFASAEQQVENDDEDE